MNHQYCTGCGMTIETPREYHPITACVLFKALLDSEAARQNLKAVIAYGMKAQRLGVSIDEALADFNIVIGVEENES